MSFIDVLYSEYDREHDPEVIAAKKAAEEAEKAAKKTQELAKIANDIAALTKGKIRSSFDKHSFAGYYGYHQEIDGTEGSDGKPCNDFVPYEHIPGGYVGGLASVKYKYRESEYSLDDMNRIKSILEGKLRELGLKRFTVRIEHGKDRITKKGIFGYRDAKIPAYLIWVECSW